MGRPPFKPKSGQIDYTKANRAPVINCLVRHEGKILIVKRSSKMRFYPGYWHCISGFLDDAHTPEEKAKAELREETGIEGKDIVSIEAGKVYELKDEEHEKTWIVHPFLADVKTNKVTLDWEADDYKWIKPEELSNFNILPGLGKVVDVLLKKQ